jgi:hypothetical protein
MNNINVVSNNGDVAKVELMDGTSRLFNRLDGSAEDFRAAFPVGSEIAVRQDLLKLSAPDFSLAMSLRSKIRNGAGYVEGQSQKITIAVPSAFHPRLNEWNEKRLATAERLLKIPRALRYDLLRSEGIPAAVAKGLRDKPSHIDAIPLQGNKGGEVQATSRGIRVPVLDRQAIIPVEWPEPVEVVSKIRFELKDGHWLVTIYWSNRVERQDEDVAEEVAVA